MLSPKLSMAADNGRNKFGVLPAQNLRELLALREDAFVECAYVTILNREPDDGGLNHYVERLFAGDRKLDILRALYESDEARRAKARIPWLDRAITRDKLMRLALLGLKPRLFGGRRQMQIWQRLYSLEKAVTSASKQVSLDLQRLSEQLQSVEMRTPTSSAKLDEPVTPATADSVLLGKSIVAKRIYKELTESMAHHDATPP